ncbi:hypothetical protein [Psychrobacter alimentarius]|uniref:hypothetical protein n=1 Tax=Psychrobacter alimentarius TaxID=261164 RepID=UPI00191889C3|nr:hypothetical protein [Psychrobacter alimentarius]
MATSVYESDIPSNSIGLLAGLVGRKLVNMIKFNNVPEQELIDNYYMEPDEFFPQALGPMLFYFEDGLVIGGGSIPSKNSVVMWVEKKENGKHREWLQEEDERAIPFYAKDYEEWDIYLDQFVESVTIIKEIPESDSKKLGLPNERGVLIKFENGLDLIMSHGLHDCSDSESLIKLKDINPYFEGRLEFISIGKFD